MDVPKCHPERGEVWGDAGQCQECYTLAVRARKKLVKKVSVALRNRMRTVLDTERNQVGHPIANLGSSVEELVEYLEEQYKERFGELPNWSELGKVLEIDHRTPISSVDMTDREQFVRIVHYSNLQLLPRTLNRKKSNKI